MNFIRSLLFLALLFATGTPVFAQWQVPDHSIPIGRGGGNIGFKAVAPGASGTILTSNGPGADPTYQVNANVGTVTNIATNGGVKGGPITSTGTVSLDANYSGYTLQNCALTASVASNVLTVAIKDTLGADPSAASPCNIGYRNSTQSAGSMTFVQQTSALSISTFAAGATLGSSNNVAFRFWVVVFNNSGTNVLGLINCSNATAIFPLNEGAIASSTGMTAGATSAGVFYTPNGVSVAAKAFRILGYVEYGGGLTTAGTYNSLPTSIQVFGPGIKKPGDVVQTVYATSATTTTNAGGTTAAPANPSVNIAPTSAANIIKATASGSINGTAGSVIAQLGRCNSCGGTVTALFGSRLTMSSGTAIGDMALIGLDLPNTTATISYAVWISLNVGGTSQWPSSVNLQSTSSIIVEEIMG